MNKGESDRRPQGEELFFDEELKLRLTDLDMIMMAAQAKKVLLLREVAAKQGLIAAKLEDLKSDSGKLFVRVKREPFDYGFATAVIRKSFKNFKIIAENAYLCRDRYSKKDGCGWVKGTPREEKYDDIGILSGSAGTRFFCRICGKQIGEHRTVMS